MDLARSTYYYRPQGRRKDDEALIERIESICVEFPRYGYRRVTAQRRHEGQRVNNKRVARIMRERGLSVKPRRPAVRTSDGGCRDAVFPNLARDFLEALLPRLVGEEKTEIVRVCREIAIGKYFLPNAKSFHPA